MIEIILCILVVPLAIAAVGSLRRSIDYVMEILFIQIEIEDD